MIPFIKLMLVSVFVTSFFAVVRLHRALDKLSLATVLVCVVTSVSLVGPISVVMSSLYKMSTKFSRNLSPKIKLVSNEAEKLIYLRELKSCPMIRCKVGGLYHMESKAKLTLVQKVINAIKYLLVNVRT